MTAKKPLQILSNRCPNCGANLPTGLAEEIVCEYCHSHLVRVMPEREPGDTGAKPTPGAAPAAAGTGAHGNLIFKRQTDPRENAFSVLVPEGWIAEGGIFRVNPTMQGGPAQSIAAKVDYTVKRDPQGSVAIRFLPDMLYMDTRMSMAGMMGMFPPGSNYQGMMVQPLPTAAQFLLNMVFPSMHPSAVGARCVDQRSLPMLAQGYRQRMSVLAPFVSFSYDAAAVMMEYQENQISYTERFIAVIENWGAAGAGMWGNKETMMMRAPAGEFSQWEPVLAGIQQSVMLNPQWVMGEIQGQIQRGEIMISTQHQVQQLERSIVEHRQATNAEITREAFYSLMGQERYVNPFTNQVEIGSNLWSHRWVDASGDLVIYSNNSSYNPNEDVALQGRQFRATPAYKANL